MSDDRDLLLDAAFNLLEEALVRHHDQQSEETFTECRVCKEWDGHKAGCPIPALEKWTNDPETEF